QPAHWELMILQWVNQYQRPSLHQFAQCCHIYQQNVIATLKPRKRKHAHCHPEPTPASTHAKFYNFRITATTRPMMCISPSTAISGGTRSLSERIFTEPSGIGRRRLIMPTWP